MPKTEMNFFKMLFLLNLVFTFFLIMLLWLTPTHNKQAEAYGWFFVAWFLFFLADIFISNFEFSELLDTITVEENEEKYPLQWFLPLKQVILISIIIGLVWGAYYTYGIVIEKKAFISVPNLFGATPYFSGTISGQIYDALFVSVLVGNVEELVWSGLLAPVLWAIIFIFVYRAVPAQKPALLISLVIASLLTGFLVSYIFHSFVYSANLYAYNSGFFHFAAAAFIDSAVGNLIPSITSHIIHNFVIKLQGRYGTYTSLPLEAYLLNPDLNRTFQ